MWYEEEFCAVRGISSLVDVDRFVGELNTLGKQGWDLVSAQIPVGDERVALMNRQRQIRTEEKVDSILKAIKSYDLAGADLIRFSLPNTHSDDGRIDYEGDSALRQLIRMVLEES